MAEFLDELLPANISYGASFKQNHAVQIHSVQNGDEFRRLLHPFVRLDYEFAYENNQQDIIEDVINFYQRTNGSFRAFRVKDTADFSTNNFTGIPTKSDMLCIACDSLGVQLSPDATEAYYFKLVRWYGDSADPYCARRIIKKPVAGTVKVSLYDGVSVYTELTVTTDFTVDYSTGIIAMVAPQAPNLIYAGCEFDIPCRFDGAPSFAISDWATIKGNSFRIREVFNP